MLNKTLELGIRAGVISLTLVGAMLCPPDTAAQENRVFNKFTATPEAIVQSGPGFFVREGNTLHSVSAVPLISKGKRMIDAKVNPFGTEFFIISVRDDKKNEADIFINNSKADHRWSNNFKKMGNPQCAVYTPDATKVLLATDRGLFTLGTVDLKPLNYMELPYSHVDMMVMSDNGYFLTVVGGSKMTVYNIENKTVRKEWDFEVKVNDVCFNDNSSDMAVATADGVVSIFDTRNFLIKKSIDDLEGALSCSYNLDGKYLAVAQSPTLVSVINLLNPVERDEIEVENGGMTTARFIPYGDDNKILLVHTATNAVHVRPMYNLTPYYARLINDEANEKMNEWLKMMPGETMEQYRERVNDETRARQKQLFEDEISTRLAPDMLSMSEMSLGKYDRANGVLEVDFDNMPSIFLPVPESDLGSFKDKKDMEFRNARYGVKDDDSFELIYAEVYNHTNGKTYIYDNIERTPLNFMADADNVVSIDLILQAQMEEQRLQEVKQQVIEEAKKQNIISDRTNITVDSRIEPDYDADGKRILNYLVKYTYEVEPEFTAVEDFAPGKYHAELSGAASSMLNLVKTSLEGDLAQYIKEGKKLAITMTGTADATPIVNRLVYDGAYGDIVEQPIYKNGAIAPMTLRGNDVITENEQLAFLRAYSVKNYIVNNVDALKNMNSTYRYDINVAEGKGSEFRRIAVEFKFVDAF